MIRAKETKSWKTEQGKYSESSEETWNYHEDGIEKKYTCSELRRHFENSPGMQEQKDQGTDFESWLNEMERMQILIPEVKRDNGKFRIRDCG